MDPFLCNTEVSHEIYVTCLVEKIVAIGRVLAKIFMHIDFKSGK